jgi:hypothetical protein
VSFIINNEIVEAIRDLRGDKLDRLLGAFAKLTGEMIIRSVSSPLAVRVESTTYARAAHDIFIALKAEAAGVKQNQVTFPADALPHDPDDLLTTQSTSTSTAPIKGRK